MPRVTSAAGQLPGIIGMFSSEIPSSHVDCAQCQECGAQRTQIHTVYTVESEQALVKLLC